MLFTIYLFGLLVTPLVSAQDLPHLIYRDTLDDVGDTDVPGPPVTDEEMEASLLNATLLEPPPEDSPLGKQTQYFQGDIILQNEDELSQLLLINETDIQNAATTDPNRNWPNGVVPYVITSFFYDRERAVIVRAMAEFKKRTCVRFIPKQRKHHDFINIKNGNGCSSSRGMMKGSQTLNLGKNCVYFDTVIHELMHAIGFIHEQSRHDRDEHVIINWQNIVQGMKHNFDKVSKSITHDLGLPYDFKSVMHYSKFAFAKNPRIPTITTKQSGKKIKGQNGFSELDVKAVNLLYKCCIDTEASCSAWAKKGECQKNPAWMARHCKKSCNKCGNSDSRIPLTASNIVDHSGFRPGGAGPAKLLQNEGFWNPNPKPWFVVFDFSQSHAVISFQVTNFGDTTHDMTAFKLEASEDLKSWTQVKTVNNVLVGTGKTQTFKLSGAGRFWRFTVTATAKGFQPYLKNIAFFGSKRQSSLIPLTTSSIVDHGGFRPGGAGPEKLLQNAEFWNPNPKPWFVVFDMGQNRVVTSFQATNYGDTTHDMSAFKLETSKDLDKWTQVKIVNNVQVGTGKIQTFKLSGTGRFWRFTVTATAKGFQPYLKRVAFFGY